MPVSDKEQRVPAFVWRETWKTGKGMEEYLVRSCFPFFRRMNVTGNWSCQYCQVDFMPSSETWQICKPLLGSRGEAQLWGTGFPQPCWWDWRWPETLRPLKVPVPSAQCDSAYSVQFMWKLPLRLLASVDFGFVICSSPIEYYSLLLGTFCSNTLNIIIQETMTARESGSAEWIYISFHHVNIL